MMKQIQSRGFTLIELLVVIAIIGILASVVLASLNSARDKGADSAVKSNLANARAEAEIFYDTARNYDTVCGVSGTNIIGDNVTAAASAGSATYTTGDTANGGVAVATCHDGNTTNIIGWAALAPLKGAGQGAFCVDSTGFAGTTTVGALDTDNDVTCN